MTNSTPTEIFRERLELDLSPTQVVLAFRGRTRLVALFGSWNHGEALIAFDPVKMLHDFDAVNLDPLQADGFGGGWIGAWGYRLGAQIESLPEGPPRVIEQPEHRVGFYDHVLRFSAGHWYLESLGAPDPSWVSEVTSALEDAERSRSRSAVAAYSLSEFELRPTPEKHREALRRVLDHIAAGDIFQANLCVRLEAAFEGDPLDVFCTGYLELQPAYGAYVSSPEGTLVSFSPELFIRRTGDEVLTSPIKGTAALDVDPAELLASAKNRAENVMIVDLMRNDLGRVCVPGSVRVPALTRLEKHAVWHLVSDVVGHLDHDVTDAELLRATFPPGSVTGAPKVRAMEVIANLESTAREAYTGAIGYVSAAAGLELNVVIRTFEFAENRVWLGVGGGIVADSVPEDEYAECLVKARPLIEAIGGTLPLHASTSGRDEIRQALVPDSPQRADLAAGVFDSLLVVDGVPVDLDAHVARLDASVRSVYGTTVRAGLDAAIRRKARPLRGRHRLRIDAVPAGDDVAVSMSTSELDSRAQIWSLEPRLLVGGQGEHKWIDRGSLRTDTGEEPLLIDVDGSVLETARGNLFVVHDDGLHTPPIDGRILPGTTRSRVIELALAAGLPVFQHRLTTTDLAVASEVFATNALRGVVPVNSCAGVGRWRPGLTTGRVAELLEGFYRDASTPKPVARRAGVGAERRVLFVDNYDSFVYNLVQYVRELGSTAEVIRNDEALVDELSPGDFTHVIVSPGPGTPADAGISADLIRTWGKTVPVLGVCLGHQVIGEVFGGAVVRAPEIVHGKPSLVHHMGAGVFAGLPSPLVFARYHSLVVTDPPPDLQVTARTASGIIMGLRHRTFPIEGVQMHPESILSSHGHEMLATFLTSTRLVPDV